MIIERDNCTLVSGAIYKCNDKGFMCLLWSDGILEHGHGFLHGGSDIVKIIRATGKRTLVTGDLEMLNRFIQVRKSSSTQLVWSKS